MKYSIPNGNPESAHEAASREIQYHARKYSARNDKLHGSVVWLKQQLQDAYARWEDCDFAAAAHTPMEIAHHRQQAYNDWLSLMTEEIATSKQARDCALKQLETIRTEKLAVRGLGEEASAVSAARVALGYGITIEEGRAALAAAYADAMEAGVCTECGGKVFHRFGHPGEFDHQCASSPGPSAEQCNDILGKPGHYQ